MKTRIEFGQIKSVVQGIGFYRTITVLETDKVSDGQIVINSTLFAETKEDLEVIDHENFQEAEDLDINRHVKDSEKEDEARELIIDIEKDVEECVQCGKLCRKDPNYPTSTQISTSFGYFCCWGCLETYAADNQKTIVSFFENNYCDELSKSEIIEKCEHEINTLFADAIGVNDTIWYADSQTLLDAIVFKLDEIL